MDNNEKTMTALQAKMCMEKLKKNGFETSYYETKEEVLSHLKEVIPSGSTIGLGGSMTLKEIGVIDWLTGNSNYNYLDRNNCDDVHKVFHDCFNADVYLMSSNAVTMDGHLLNVDGTGNRVAALIYGPKTVYVVVGVNKLVRTLDDALHHVETYASPANNIRLNKPNPCAEYGTCMHCNKETTICNQYVVSRRNGIPGRIHVLIVNEKLGY